ncbi:MAG: insulinase family protein [Cyclobacteriaceae bacterium]|nr:insulinase family protein [Cyclobacteriaceae bacterium]
MIIRRAIFLFLVLSTLSVYAQKKKSKTPETTPAATVPVVETKPQIPPPVKVTSVEGISEYRLSNGLRVLLFPDNSKQTFTLNVTYLVGSKHENYGETGMAHLLEHLVFKGTPKYPFNIMKELEDRGADFNGSTSSDRTNYYETLTATDENLKWAIEMEADRMVNSFIAQKDLDSEMTVVRNEYESGENNPIGVMFKKLPGAAYQWHSYGKSTIGERSDIENVSIERLQAFYRKYYQPDNAVVVLAGKFEEEKTLGYVNEYFGAIPKPERELPTFYTREPAQDGERVVTVKRVGDIQYVAAAYHIPSGSHEDYAPIAILVNILTTRPSGRLHKTLVDSKKASSVFPITLVTKEPGIMMVFAQVLKEKSLDDARTTMVKTFNEIAINPPTKEEVDRAKGEILKQFELNFNNSDRIGKSLSEYIALGDWRLLFLYRDRIEKVTPDDVLRVAKEYLKEDNRTIGLFIPTEKPDRAEIPGEPDVAALVKDYKGKQAVASGEEFDPSPANIESRTVRSTLPNGMKVAYLQKKTRGESVQLRMTLRFGDEKNLVNKGTTGQFTASLLDKGTSKMTRQQVKDEFDRLKARVSFFGSASVVSVSIETTGPNLGETLKLVGHILKEASFPADEFEKLKNERIAGIESNRTEPQSVASIRLQKHTSPYPKGDPRYAEDFDESIASMKALKLDDIKKFHKDFYGANNGTLAITGDFDRTEIGSIITEQFGNWKSPANYKRLESRIKKVEPIDEKIETPDKANAFFLAQYSWEYSDSEPDYAALELGHYMLGGGTASRLFSRIRGKEGISYGVGSFFNASNLDKVGNFTAYAIYAPENVGKLEETFKEEILKAVNEGFTAEEVEAAKSGWLQQRGVGRAQDASVTSTLNGYLFTGRTMKWDEELEKKVQGLSVEEINAAMKKYMNYEKLNMVKAGDFAKAKAKAEGN